MKPKLRDGFNYLSKLSFLRVWNMVQLVSSYWISKISKKAYHFGSPTSISLEPSTSCNLRCPECPSGLRNFTRPTGMLTDETYRSVIDQLGERLTYLIFYFQGEPYLNPKFLDQVKYASAKILYSNINQRSLLDR